MPTFSYFATVLQLVASYQQKMSDFEEEQREEVDALASIFSEEMMVTSLIICTNSNYLQISFHDLTMFKYR